MWLQSTFLRIPTKNNGLRSFDGHPSCCTVSAARRLFAWPPGSTVHMGQLGRAHAAPETVPSLALMDRGTFLSARRPVRCLTSRTRGCEAIRVSPNTAEGDSGGRVDIIVVS